VQVINSYWARNAHMAMHKHASYQLVKPGCLLLRGLQSRQLSRDGGIYPAAGLPSAIEVLLFAEQLP